MIIEHLRGKRDEIFTRLCEMRDRLHAEEREFTAEEQENWDRLNGDFDDLTRSIEREEKFEALSQQMESRAEAPHPRIGREDQVGDDCSGESRQPKAEAPDAETRALAIQGWMLRASGREVDERHRRALERCLTGENPVLRTEGRELVVSLRNNYPAARQEVRAQSALQGSLGGYLAPDASLVSQIETAMLVYGGLRDVADVIRTSSGNDIPMPTANETAVKGRRVSENEAATTVDLDFGIRTLKAYKYTSDIIKVPRELLQDSPFNLMGYIGSRVGERIARAQADDYVLGTGNSQPQGIIEGSTLGVTAAGSTTFTGDELIDLFHSVGEAYRRPDMGAGWLMRDTTMKIVRKLKGGDGHYLWGPGLNGGAAGSLLGYPLRIVEEIPAPASGAKSVIFGALRKYLIRDVAELRIQHLIERYAEADQDAFVAWHRTDGFVLDAGTNPIRHLVHA